MIDKNKELYSGWKERLISALRKHGHKRAETSAELGVTTSHMNRLMNKFAKEDEAFKKEFWSPEISMKLKRAACRKTRRLNRLTFIKENKHLILQAYYQHGKIDH